MAAAAKVCKQNVSEWIRGTIHAAIQCLTRRNQAAITMRLCTGLAGT
jgi:hypothetical protein